MLSRDQETGFRMAEHQLTSPDEIALIKSAFNRRSVFASIVLDKTGTLTWLDEE